MFKYIILIYLLFNFSLSAEVVQKLEVKGNDRISTETIKVYGDIDLNKDYSNFDLDRILKNLYETNFFDDIKISLTKGILSITVKEYAVLNSVNLLGEKSTTIKEKILKRLALKAKESFRENKLTEDINELKNIYASMGFNFVNIEVKVERFNDNRVNLIYFVEKGKKTNISKINFIGDKKVKEKRLRDLIVSEEKKFWKFLSKNTFLNKQNIELDKRLLINYYKSIGFYDVQVLSNSAEISENDSTTLTYTINAGNRYRINKISTNVTDVLDKNIFTPLNKNYRKNVGKYYSPFIVKRLLDDLDLLIADNDIQFIEHSVNEILEDGNIEIKINVYEGEKKLVEKINIIGNTVTNENVIRSELLLDEGDPFSNLKLEQSIASIKSRNIFATVKSKVSDGANNNQKIIEILVEEQPTGEISAGAGIGTNGGSFSFNITENNWLGRGVNVTTNAEVSAETFTGGIEFTDPNYNFSGNSLTYFLVNSSNDKSSSGFKNNIFTTGIGTKFEQYRDIYLSPSLRLSSDTLKVDSTASESMKKQKGTFVDLAFEYGIALDARDKVYAPTDGYISRFSQSLPLYADSPFLRNSYALSMYETLTPNAIGAFKFQVTNVTGLDSKDVRLSKRSFISTNRLRGFEAGKVGPKDGKDYVGGNNSWATNFEVSLPNFLPESTKTDVGLFLDFGNVWGVDYDSSIDDSNKIRSTAGINTSWLSPVGPMTFVFSQNISKAKTDITESFNFKLGTTF